MKKYYDSDLNVEDNLFPIKIINKIQDRTRIFKNFISFDNDDFSDDNQFLLLEKVKKGNVYVCGWGFRVRELTKKYQDIFIKKYSLSKKYHDKNDFYKHILELKKTKTLVGVHIRRGDYRGFLGGQYYFDDEVYKKYIENVKNIEEIRDKDLLFVIFSD